MTEQTYFRWRKSHGGLKVDQAKRVRDLEAENARLKRAAAQSSLGRYLQFYYARRSHQALDRKTPDHVYFNSLPALPLAKAA